MKTFIYPHNPKSLGARNLSEALDVRRISHIKSSFKGGKDKTVINWGASEVPSEVQKCVVLNSPGVLSNVIDKRKFFQLLEGKVSIPKWTSSLKIAMSWAEDGKEVLARSLLKGHSGRGIIFFDDDPDNKDFLKAGLFTQYKKKKEEFRLHFAFGEMIGYQKKVLRKTDDDGNPIDPKRIDFRVRSYKNGFIFQREDISLHDDVLEQSKKAFEVSNLDFGAVDVIWNEQEGRAYILEINTAPGIEGTTVNEYEKAFRNALRDL